MAGSTSNPATFTLPEAPQEFLAFYDDSTQIMAGYWSVEQNVNVCVRTSNQGPRKHAMTISGATITVPGEYGVGGTLYYAYK